MPDGRQKDGERCAWHKLSWPLARWANNWSWKWSQYI